MTKSGITLFFAFWLAIPLNSQTSSVYELTYSTFLGGSHFEQARDLAIDAEGNIYVTGGTSSPDFPTTPGAFMTAYNNAGGPTVGSWGPMMAFVAKFSPTGELIWSTLLGGPNYDRAYAIEVDKDGFVYLGGRAGENFPTTPGAYQELFTQSGSKNNLYGHQNGFLAKLSPDGSELIWSTYYGSDSFGFFRDMDIDDEGYIYGILNAVLKSPQGIPADAFDTTHNGSYDMVAVKFNQDATAVEWATFLGGSGEDRGGPAVRVGPDKSVYVGGGTQSSDFPTTPNAIQSQLNGTSDFFVTRIAPDGKSLIYSTYFGGSGTEASETHSLFVDHLGQAYVACYTNSPDIPTTPTAWKTQKPNTSDGDALLFKLSTDGNTLLACSYFGGVNHDGPEGLYVDSLQNLYVGGGTSSDGLPVTADAAQSQRGGGGDGFILKLNPDFSTPLFFSYFGGSADESVRAFNVKKDGTICFSGQTDSGNFPLTMDAMQTSLASPGSQPDSYLTILGKTEMTPIQNLYDLENAVLLYPNPANTSVSISSPEEAIARIQITDLLGRNCSVDASMNTRDILLQTRHLMNGSYLVTIHFENGTSIQKSLIITH